MREQMYLVKSQSFKEIKTSQELYLDKIIMEKSDITIHNQYYGPYKQDSTSTKKRLVLGQDQCTGCGTDKTSGTIGQGVAKSRNYIYTEYTHVLTYLCTKYTDILMYQTLLQRSLCI